MGQIVNLRYLETVCEGDRDFMQEMIVAFLETIPQSIRELQVAANAEDWEQLARVAHKMKPSIAFMGIEPMKILVADIETMAKSGSPSPHLPQLVLEMGALSQTAITELQEALKTF